VTNALLPLFGGPAGVHTRPRGVFYRPLPWAIGIGALLFTVLYLRHQPCLTTDPANPINAYIRACYSDLPVTYTWRGWAAGGSPLGGEELAVAPLLGIVVLLVLWLARMLGADVHGGATEAEQYAGVPAFFGASAIILFVGFLLLVVASAVIAARRGRPWDVLFVAASPVVLAAGLVSWDLVALGLTGGAMALLARRRHVEAGVVLGAAASAATMPLAFALAAGAALLLRRRMRELAYLVAASTATWLLIHLPYLLRDFDQVYAYYHAEITKDVGYGSVWYLAQEGGAPLRELGAFAFVVTLLLLGVLVAWLYVTGRTPRVGALAAAIVLVVVLLAPAYPPQAALWVVFALFLAFPVDRLLWAVAGVHALHYLAVWGWLSGHLTVEKNGPVMLYYLAVLTRLVLEIVLLYLAVRAMARPDTDPLGEPTAPRRAVPVAG
jgi:hypothetical protein